ncbi:MAG: class III signal peptide-containing protein [Candidatus Anstonellaceae archaeon]
MKIYKRAQLSTEYLIILAIVLIIALIISYFFNFFPSLNLYANYSASKNFWAKDSYPISIEESYYKNSTSRLYLSLTSKEKENITINSIFVDKKKLAFFLYNASALEGVGNALCNPSSCILSNCNCELVLTPFSNTSIVFEKYDFSDSSSSCQGIIFEKSLGINYTIENIGPLFYQPIFKLPISCIN